MSNSNTSLSGQEPTKHPDGTLIYPDGTIINPDGFMGKLIFNPDGRIVGTQYYREDQVTPLLPGESITLPSGEVYVQELMRDMPRIVTSSSMEFIPDDEGSVMELIGNEVGELSDGTTITAKGELIWINGVKAKLIPGASGSGFQYYTSEGVKLLPGEEVTMPDGQVIRQELL
jgi:hypothetical protein